MIDTTGPDSTNIVKEKTKNHTKVRNYNDLSASNKNNQDAWSGDAKVRHNTKGGDAKSGSASNANAMSLSATVDNTASSAAKAMPVASSNSTATIKNTGPDSVNRVEITNTSHVNVKNDNDVKVTNTSSQMATSGNATVSDNTTGGSATTGNASNTNATTMTFKLSN